MRNTGYMKGDGSTQAQNLTVGAHSRSTVSVNNALGSGDDASHDFSAKVECTNSQQIIAERPSNKLPEPVSLRALRRLSKRENNADVSGVKGGKWFA